MATKTGIINVESTTPPAENLGNVFFNFLANIDGISATSATSFLAHSTDGSTFDVDLLIEGTGFKYDNNVHQSVTGGTATGFSITDNDNADAPLVHATFAPGMSITAVKTAADFLLAHPGDTSKLDAIFGAYTITFNGNDGTETWKSSSGNDTLNGGAGDDILFGGAGNDTIEGGAGNDHLDGGAGTGDTVSYAHSSIDGVIVDLNTQYTIDDINQTFVGGTPQSGGDAAGDQLAGFENIIGSDNNDVLTGTSGANVISGGGGDDHISGGGGNDTLDGGDSTNDYVDYTYLGSETSLTITLGEAGVITKTSGLKTDIDSIKNFESVLSGEGNDVVTGNSAFNDLHGQLGNDTLEGGGGADNLNGEGGTDTASYAHSATGVFVNLDLQGTNVADQAMMYDFGAGSVNNGDAAGDQLESIENLIGSAHNDVLISGTHADDVVGPVRIDGGAGNDIIVGSAATDTLIGGANIDTLSYENSTDGVTLSLATQATLSKTGALTGGTAGSSGDADGDTFTGFENLRGGADENSLTGDKNANIIEGGASSDFLDGGLGFDLVSYEHSAPVSVDLTLQGTSDKTGAPDIGSATAQTGTGDQSGDLLYGFEGVIGSGGDDQLYANQNPANTIGNTLEGGDGNDYMQGGFGKDTILGGAGDDEGFLGLGKGGDTFDGGDGIDWATFNADGEAAGITITLGTDGTATGFKASGGAATGDKLLNVENLGGTTLNDVLTGNNLDNQIDGGSLGNDVLSGMAGNDTLVGDDGDDRLIGGAGNDILDGGNGTDTVDYSASGAGVMVDLSQQGDYLTPGNPTSGRDPGSTGTTGHGGDADGDIFYGIENVIGTKFNDTLIAHASGSRLDGGAGDDEVAGGSGSDILIGGAGNDYALYENSSGGITVDLSHQWTIDKSGNPVSGSGSFAHGGDADGDQLSGIESITGGTGEDILIGDKNANTLNGGDGNDRLDGGAGNDTLNGGDGDDTFVYDGQGKDTIDDFNQGEDVLEITGAPKTFTSVLDVIDNAQLDGNGNTVITFDSKNSLTLLGFTGTLTTVDVVFNAPIVGTNGPDDIQGNALANKIDGGAGDDTIEGLGGGDTLIGGAGNDWLSYGQSGAAVTVELVAKGVAITSGGDADGDTATLFENIVGSANADELTGDSGNNMIAGGVGNDIIDGGAGNDTVNYSYLGAGSQLTITLGANGAASTATYTNGDEDTLSNIENLIGGSENDIWTGNSGVNIFKAGAGDDTLNGGGGKDTLDGGDGLNDTADFTGVTVGLTIAMKDTGATSVTGGGTSAGTQLLNIENIIGGNGNDVLTGNTSSNRINGGDGDDKIFASLGDSETYSGGDGNDTVTFEKFTTAVSVTIGQNSVSGSATGIDHLTISNDIESLIGSSGNDVLTGGSGGGALSGGAGNDVLTGGNGDDVLNGGAGDDIINGGAGADAMNGGGGNDTLSYENDILGVNVTLHTKASADLSGGNANGDTAIGFANVIGGGASDTIDGSLDTAPNIIDGGAGQNVGDTLTGGDNDTVSFASLEEGVGVTVTLNLDPTIAATVHGAAQFDTIKGFGSIIGTAFNDTLIGDDGNNVINGGDGDDVLGAHKGIDVLIGGDGTDVVSLIDATPSGVTINLAAGTTVAGSSKNTLQSVEVALGSNQDDIFNAVGFNHASKNAGSISESNEDGAFNSFRGGAGNDHITGNGSTRIRYEDAGSNGAAINLDSVSHTTLSAIVVDAHTARGDGVGIDTLGDGNPLHDTGISQAEGSNFNDVFWGGSGNEIFYGLDGNDAIFGGDGFDSAGYNIIKSGDTALSGADGISVDLAGGSVTGITGTATALIGTDSLHSVEAVVGSNADDAYNATGFGAGSTNAGSNGDLNMFEGLDGDDTITGNGDTRVSYQRALDAVSVTLQTGGAGSATSLNGGDAAHVGNDTFRGGVKAVRGSDYNDQITGNGESDKLDGWLGNDTLTGGTGEDTFVYSIGTNGSQRGGGADHIVGFELGIDQIDLTGVTTVHTFATLSSLMKDVGSDVVINFGSGNTLTVEGIHKADFTAHQSDILLA